MPKLIKQWTILAAMTAVVSAQTIHLPDYFPVQDGAQWVYKDEFENYDTATMRTGVPFAGKSAISISFGLNEAQFFSADSTGLQMLGQTIPTGTFSFDTPLGIAGLDVTVGERSFDYNWLATHVASGKHRNWGEVYCDVLGLIATMSICGSVYNDIVVIETNFLRGRCCYYLAKNVGIISATSVGSPFFQQRELVEFLPASNAVSTPWRAGAPAFNLHIAGSTCGMRSDLSFPMYSSLLRLKIFSPDGRLLLQRRYRETNNATVNLTRDLAPGRYIATLQDGSVRTSRVFSILP